MNAKLHKSGFAVVITDGFRMDRDKAPMDAGGNLKIGLRTDMLVPVLEHLSTNWPARGPSRDPARGKHAKRMERAISPFPGQPVVVLCRAGDIPALEGTLRQPLPTLEVTATDLAPENYQKLVGRIQTAGQPDPQAQVSGPIAAQPVALGTIPQQQENEVLVQRTDGGYMPLTLLTQEELQTLLWIFHDEESLDRLQHEPWRQVRAGVWLNGALMGVEINPRKRYAVFTAEMTAKYDRKWPSFEQMRSVCLDVLGMDYLQNAANRRRDVNNAFERLTERMGLLLQSENQGRYSGLTHEHIQHIIALSTPEELYRLQAVAYSDIMPGVREAALAACPVPEQFDNVINFLRAYRATSGQRAVRGTRGSTARIHQCASRLSKLRRRRHQTT